jgi:uncharacterized membrane protein YebE (DUF533 family)
MKTTLMNKVFGILALGTLALTATGAQADWGRDGMGYGHNGHATTQSRAFSQQVNTRQAQQRQRIEHGVHAGRLTRAETRELMHEQHRIQAMKRHFRADGVIDAREYRRLDHALDTASRHIMAEKHDRQAYPVHRFN